MISDRELELNGWRRDEGVYRLTAPSPRTAGVRVVIATVQQRPRRGWWFAQGITVDESSGRLTGSMFRLFRTARAAMAWLQGEPWRRG